MKLLPKLLIAGGIVGGIVYGIQHYRPNLPFASQLFQPTQNLQGSVEGISESVGEQTKVLGERTKEVTGHVQNVLGTAIQVNEETGDTQDTEGTNQSSEPVHEKAFEYGRYLYCQQVVKDYEAEQEN